MLDPVDSSFSSPQCKLGCKQPRRQVFPRRLQLDLDDLMAGLKEFDSPLAELREE
jgi:hypothetical protein